MVELGDRETRLLGALCLMAGQYLEGGGMLDSECIGAGERAIAVLAEYGLVEITHEGRCGSWTPAGQAFNDAI